MNLEILYQDEHLVAINKPHGLLVHRSEYSGVADTYAVQALKTQLGQKVHPCHRIDRKTGGVLLFALSREVNSIMQQQFAANLISKKYIAIVRGYTDDSGEIDYPLTNDKGKIQESLTLFKTLNRVELEIPFGKFNTSRYSLVEVFPQTGRMHQIRKHFAHIMHPIIGDRPHGCNKQNKFFKEKWNMNTMLLHASEIRFNCPITSKEIKIKADIQSELKRMMDLFRFDLDF